MSIHPAAAAGFSRSADAYERGRPDYPPEAIALVSRRLELGPGRTVIDLAAGTGKLTRALAATGADVVAVEPVAQMRDGIGPGIRALDGTAEAIPLEDGSADAVTVAQAFHWFDGEAALAEIYRVLRPGGALALVWNRRLLEDPVHQDIERIIAPHRGDAPAHRLGAWRSAFERTELFGPLEETELPNWQTLDADGLADRIGSTSFVAALADAERAEVLAETRALAEGGPVTLRYVAEVQVADRRG